MNRRDRRDRARTSLLARLLAGTLCGTFLFAPAQAQTAASDYPNKPVKIVVPFPPGGTSDVMGRVIAEELARQFKAQQQPFIVDNKAGAGGAIGTDQVAKAPADGYTLLLSGIGSNAVIHGFASPKPAYTEADFIHISQLAAGPNVLVEQARKQAPHFSITPALETHHDRR